jgi:hypothetical protein
MKKIKTIITFLAIGIAALTINASAQTTVQRSFLKKADFNLDGKLEEVHLIIYGENIKKMFKWELSVQMEGKTIYHDSCDDSWYEEGIKDSDKDASYEAKKKEYYFKELPESFVVYKKFSKEDWIKDDYYLKRNVENTIQEELKKYNIVGQKAQTIIKAAISRLTQGVSTLDIFCSPPEGDVLMFIPEINTFVRYYVP